ncbi:unnamed protein product [Coffea canephora]|uniref:Uncharacterized protein n=1 Tax=Coffea canephora TaxID=49390 RepID=A0A068V2D1_COFCA|nr:unnamed protein product [Coffea canephora]
MEVEHAELLQPFSPSGQYLRSSAISLSVIAVMESEISIDDSMAIPLLYDVFLPINPRFSSMTVGFLAFCSFSCQIGKLTENGNPDLFFCFFFISVLHETHIYCFLSSLSATSFLKILTIVTSKNFSKFLNYTFPKYSKKTLPTINIPFTSV